MLYTKTIATMFTKSHLQILPSESYYFAPSQISLNITRYYIPTTQLPTSPGVSHTYSDTLANEDNSFRNHIR
jgi:hypothetical protein